MPPIAPSRKPAATAAVPDVSGVHVWLVLWKAFVALHDRAGSHIDTLGLGRSDFGVLEVLLAKGPLPVNVIGPKVNLTPGSISVAVERLVRKGLVRRRDQPEDRRIRLVELTARGRAVIVPGFCQHRAAMEAAAAGLTLAERATLIRLLKKLGKSAAVQCPEVGKIAGRRPAVPE